jgi:hypothetical protein
MKIASKPTYKLSLSRLLLPVLLAVACMAQRGLSEEQGKGGMDYAKNSTIAMARDPFWPVGYTPEWLTQTEKIEEVAVVEGNGNEDWNKAMKQVVINGVSSRADNEFFAVINGQVKTVGETISVTLGSSTYSWAVESITPPSSVKLRRVSVK